MDHRFMDMIAPGPIKTDIEALQEAMFAYMARLMTVASPEVVAECLGIVPDDVDAIKKTGFDALRPVLRSYVLLFRPVVNLVKLGAAAHSKLSDELPHGVAAVDDYAIVRADQIDRQKQAALYERRNQPLIPVEHVELHQQYQLTLRSAARELNDVTMALFFGVTTEEIDRVRQMTPTAALHAISTYVTYFQPRIDFAYLARAPSRGTSMERAVNEAIAGVFAGETTTEKLIKYLGD